jgi:predicted transcriptional regulator
MRIDRVKFAAALARKDLTVKQVAELSGVSRVTVSSVKTGKSCSQATADKLARVLGRDIIANTPARVDNAN